MVPEGTGGPLQVVFDASTPNGNPALVGFYANGIEWGDKKVRVNTLSPQTARARGTKLGYLDEVSEVLMEV